MSTLSSTILLAAVHTFVDAPTRANRDALAAAADEYRELWVFGQTSDNTVSREHASISFGSAARTQKFDLSRIMDDLQTTCA